MFVTKLYALSNTYSATRKKKKTSIYIKEKLRQLAREFQNVLNLSTFDISDPYNSFLISSYIFLRLENFFSGILNDFESRLQIKSLEGDVEKLIIDTSIFLSSLIQW